jgi:hypothetical protein
MECRGLQSTLIEELGSIDSGGHTVIRAAGLARHRDESVIAEIHRSAGALVAHPACRAAAGKEVLPIRCVAAQSGGRRRHASRRLAARAAAV